MRRWRAFAFAGVLAVAPLAGQGQDDDGAGFLGRLIEDNLSSAGRTVDIQGFEGALSSSATLRQLTIADEDGIWLTLRDVSLDWSRAALLAGRIDVESLSASELILERLPPSQPSAPSPEASGFSLPDLPVSVQIGQLSIGRAALGEPVLGQAVEATLTGAIGLADGEGNADISLTRTDGQTGAINLQAAYANETEELAVDLEVSEGPGGIAASLIGLPGEPALALRVEGAGPLSDFSAELALSTNAQDRLAGSLLLTKDPDTGANRFSADLGGDIAPLFAPEYRAFFGPDIRLVAEGASLPSGDLSLETFRLTAEALDLTGEARIGANGLPDQFNVEGQIAAVDGAPVLLPVGGDEIRVGSVDLQASLNSDAGDTWTAEFAVSDLTRADLALQQLALRGSGLIGLEAGQRTVDADLELVAAGIAHANDAVGAALGEALEGEARVEWRDGAPLTLSGLEVRGAGLMFNADATLETTDTGLAYAATSQLSADDLARFSPLVGQPLRGGAEIGLEGSGDAVQGTFDLRITGTGSDLAVGVPEADAYLSGASAFDITARRTVDGTFLDRFELKGTGVEADAMGQIATPPGENAVPVAEVQASARLDDISPLSGRSGQSLSGGLSVRVEARSSVDGQQAAVTLDATGRSLGAGMAEVDPYLAGETTLRLVAQRNRERVDIQTLGFRSDLSELNLRGVASIPEASAPGFDGQVSASLGDISPLSGFVGQDLAGAMSLEAEGSGLADGTSFDITLSLEGSGLAAGVPEIDPYLDGATRLRVAASRTGESAQIETLQFRGNEATLDIEGTATLPQNGVPGFDGRISGAVSSLTPLSGLVGRDLSGGLSIDAEGSGQADGQNFNLSLSASGSDIAAGVGAAPFVAGDVTFSAIARREGERATIEELQLRGTGIEADVKGSLSLPSDAAPEFDGTADVSMDDLSRLAGLVGRAIAGAIEARAEGRFKTDLSAFDLSVTGQGSGLRTGQPEVDKILGGRLELDASAMRDGNDITINRGMLTTSNGATELSGRLNGTDGQVALDARLNDLALLVPGFPGAAGLSGTIRETGQGYGLDLDATGPGGTTGALSGTVAEDFGSVDIAATGNAPLALANPFIAPRALSGTARYDLQVRGAPGLGAVSGQVTLGGARLVAPALGVALDAINGSVSLGDSRATLGINAQVQGGGQIEISGPVALTAPYTGDIRIAIGNARLADPTLYEVLLGGDVTISGPLTGGAQIAGDILVSSAEIRVPSSNVGVSGVLPDITHVGEPVAVRATRARAGLLGQDSGGSSGGAAFPLDVTIRAPGRIFVRGRGLDVELGGNLRVRGTTSNVIPEGGLELIRGRLDILGQRLGIDEGTIRLEGALVPIIRLVAEAEAGDTQVIIVVEGRATEPQISFLSSPELPEDEVLSALLFGRNVSELSAFQAAQLAAAVAELAGRGGVGIIGRLRESTGLDDLDVTTSEEGSTAVRAGKYLTENIYTDVTVSDGDTKINLNLDVIKNVTITGSVDSTGDSGIGVFFQRDY